ncbi:MAG: hypothetical protein WBR13_08710 [Allosphingosinicella sp.]
MIVRGFISHAFEDAMYEGGREAFKEQIHALVGKACAELSNGNAEVENRLNFECVGYGLPLPNEIRRLIRECDFLIADISQPEDGSRPVNPNVMYEVGYAMALNKQVLVMRRNAKPPPPSDIAEILAGTYPSLTDIPNKFLARMVEIVTQTLARVTLEPDRNEPLIAQVWFPAGTQEIHIICAPEVEPSSFSDPLAENFLQIDRYEDRDALFELSTFFARRYPEARLVRHVCDNFPSDILTGNIVLLGGPGCKDDEGNSVTRDFMQRLGSKVSYPKTGKGLIWGDDPLRPSRRTRRGVVEDWGTILAAQNPRNPAARVIILHGTLTYGTLAAATALIDTPSAMGNHLRLAALDLVDQLNGGAQFELLVKVQVGSGNAIWPPAIDFDSIRHVKTC